MDQMMGLLVRQVVYLKHSQNKQLFPKRFFALIWKTYPVPLVRFGTVIEVAVAAAWMSADQVDPPSDEYLISKPSVGASFT
jgi:hypothetical protein